MRSFRILAVLMPGLGFQAGMAVGQSFQFAFLGDNPYGGFFNVPAFEALIDDVNDRGDIEWVVHVGDTKAGVDPCSDAFLRSRFQLFQGFDAPFVFTPGDNDWFDCGGRGPGTGDVYERLAFLRSLYFPLSGQTTGGRPMPVTPQASDSGFSEYVENVRWERGGVVFATVHLFAMSRAAPDQSVADRRMDAAISWIREAFKEARESGSLGVFLATQVDPWVFWGLPGLFENSCPQCALPTPGIERLYPVLVEESKTFAGQVVFAVGDTHIFRVDKPLYDPANGQLVENFTRVETFGNPSVHWVRVTVDPTDPQVFSFHPQLVAANLRTR